MYRLSSLWRCASPSSPARPRFQSMSQPAPRRKLKTAKNRSLSFHKLEISARNTKIRKQSQAIRIALAPPRR